MYAYSPSSRSNGNPSSGALTAIVTRTNNPIHGSTRSGRGAGSGLFLFWTSVSNFARRMTALPSRRKRFRSGPVCISTPPPILPMILRRAHTLVVLNTFQVRKMNLDTLYSELTLQTQAKLVLLVMDGLGDVATREQGYMTPLEAA